MRIALSPRKVRYLLAAVAFTVLMVLAYHAGVDPAPFALVGAVFTGPKFVKNQTLLVSQNSVSIDLPRNRFIQKIFLRLNLYGDTAGSVTAGADKAAKFISAVRLKLNGKDVPFSLSFTDLNRITRYIRGADVRNSLITTISQTGVLLGTAEAVIDLRADFKNEKDVSCLLPAHALTGLTLEFDTAAAADLGTGYTPASTGTLSSVDVSVKEVDLTEAEVNALSSRGQWPLRRSLVAATLPSPGTVSSYNASSANILQLPIGEVIRRLWFHAVNNALASDAFVSEYRVRDNRLGVNLVGEVKWADSQMQDSIEYGIDQSLIVAGLTVADFESLGWVDATRMKKGDLELAALTVSATGTNNFRVVTESYIPAKY